jgi:hypothetical protein
MTEAQKIQEVVSRAKNEMVQLTEDLSNMGASALDANKKGVLTVTAKSVLNEWGKKVIKKI